MRYRIEYERTHDMWLVIDKDTDETMSWHHSKAEAKKLRDMLNELWQWRKC